MRRRSILKACATLIGFSAMAVPTYALASEKISLEVWKTPTCGCCQDWIDHVQANGFNVKINEVSDAQKSVVRARLGMAEKFGSCHTAIVGGYVLEGHVPAEDIHRLLIERPSGLGIAVPGMPVGSPGMDGPKYGGRKMPYDVLLVQRSGDATIYHSYR